MKHADRIPTPPLSEFLVEEFMKPLGISASTLSEGANIPISEVYGLMRDEIEMTPELSAKLGAFFGISNNVFYRINETIKARTEMPELKYA